MKTVFKKQNKSKKILFVDFNGVISYNTFWMSLKNPKHPLHAFSEPIEELLFKSPGSGKELVVDWMLGKYTSEEIHQIIAEELGVPYQDLFEVFREDCKNLDISSPILEKISKLRGYWHCILRTDNMDSFERFTLPANPDMSATFHSIHSSSSLRQLKKTDGGKYFLDTVKNLGIEIEKCVLIDDGDRNCELFETLGGKSFCTKTEKEALEALEALTSLD